MTDEDNPAAITTGGFGRMNRFEIVRVLEQVRQTFPWNGPTEQEQKDAYDAVVETIENMTNEDNPAATPAELSTNDAETIKRNYGQETR